jgi:hypothetical protein
MVHSSDPPSPWEGYRRCLSDIPECSHLLIIQDDALPCVNFPVALESVAERFPSTPVCLFLGAAPASAAGRARRAHMRKERYVHLGPASFVPLVAVLWPREKAEAFLEWSQTAKKITRSDDGNASRWVRSTNEVFMVSVPSLVEHNDFVPSVKGGPGQARRHKPGKESWRSAALLAEDGAAYKW